MANSLSVDHCLQPFLSGIVILAMSLHTAGTQLPCSQCWCFPYATSRDVHSKGYMSHSSRDVHSKGHMSDTLGPFTPGVICLTLSLIPFTPKVMCLTLQGMFTPRVMCLTQCSHNKRSKS